MYKATFTFLADNKNQFWTAYYLPNQLIYVRICEFLCGLSSNFKLLNNFNQKQKKKKKKNE